MVVRCCFGLGSLQVGSPSEGRAKEERRKSEGRAKEERRNFLREGRGEKVVGRGEKVEGRRLNVEG